MGEEIKGGYQNPLGSTTTTKPGERRARTLDGRSVPRLLKELSSEVSELVRLEVELAKTEMTEKLGVFQKSTTTMVIGATVLLAAMLILLWALNMGLTALLAQFMSQEIAIWLSPLILAIVLGAIGWGMIQGGKRKMKKEGLAPTQTRESLQADRRWAREKARDVRQEIREEQIHG